MSDVVLHVVRHGESLANVADREGTKRPPDADRLSELGWEQARTIGRRLQDTGIEVIVASPMVRAQETAQGIAELVGAPIEADEDLHEIRQSTAFYAASPDFGDLHSNNWMPKLARDEAEPGAESFDTLVARVRRVQDRAEARAGVKVLAVSHFGFLHFILGVTLFGNAFGPEHLRGLWMAGHANTGVSIFEHAPQRVMDGMDLSGWMLTTWNAV
jgi:probable phosphoglycerate mutase